MANLYTIEGSMTRRPGAPTNRFKYVAEAGSLQDALNHMEVALEPEKGYKVTSVECVKLKL